MTAEAGKHVPVLLPRNEFVPVTSPRLSTNASTCWGCCEASPRRVNHQTHPELPLCLQVFKKSPVWLLVFFFFSHELCFSTIRGHVCLSTLMSNYLRPPVRCPHGRRFLEIHRNQWWSLFPSSSFPIRTILNLQNKYEYRYGFVRSSFENFPRIALIIFSISCAFKLSKMIPRIRNFIPLARV